MALEIATKKASYTMAVSTRFLEECAWDAYYALGMPFQEAERLLITGSRYEFPDWMP